MSKTSHIKSTFRHAIIYGGAGLIGRAVGFIMLPIYSHHLKAEGYGVLGMIDSVLSIMSLLIGYGISGAMSRFYYETSNPEQRKEIVSTIVILMFFLVVGVTSPVLSLNKQVAWLAFGRNDWGYYIILATITFMGTMTSKNAENYVLILQKSFFLSAVSLARLVFSLSLFIYFIVVLKWGVLGYLYASLIDAYAYTFFMHAYTLGKVGIRFNKAIAKKTLSFSLPLVPGYIAMFIRNNADRVLLRTYLGLSQVGVYSMLFKFVYLIGIFAVAPFTKIWQVKRFEVCDLKDGPEIIAKVFTYHMVVLVFMGLIFSFEIPIVLKLLTPKEFWLSGFVVYFVVLSRVFAAAYQHIFFGLLYAKKTAKISMLQAMSAAATLALTVPLTIFWGLLGAALAALLISIFQCTIAYVMAKPYYKVPYQWNAIGIMLASATGLFIVGKDLTISNTFLADWLNFYVVPWVEVFGGWLRLDQIKEGILLNRLVDSVVLLSDATLLLLYSGLFILGLVLFRIIPRDLVLQFFSLETLRRPHRLLL